ncbi:MAG: iron ABC transporter substrate-binding protein [Deltaproteobacteria bacterium]|nr:iron ABC transporter substrate-binding protein [Deltaproteobacteria bacterium]
MKKPSCIFLLCCMAALASLWAVGLAMAGDSMTVTDMEGRKVAVPADPNRVIAIGPGTLRILCYLEAKEKIAGIENFENVRTQGRPYWIASPELKDLPVIGPGGPQHLNKEPDLEAVLKVNPDVIFATYMKPATADALQKKIGIPVVILTYGRFPAFNERLYDSLRLAGKILGKEARAEAVVDFIEGAKKDLLKRTDGIDPSRKPRVYIGGVGFRGVQGIESTDPDYIPLEWVRADNIAAGASGENHLFIDREKLLMWDPDVIFVDAGGYGLIKQDFEKKSKFYQSLKAFQNGRVYVLLPFIYYVANIGTAVADAYGAGKILYPERFQDIDLAEKADEIYTFLVGAPAYKKMVRDFGPLGAPF